MKVLEIKEDEFENEVLKYKGKILVDFYADWCMPCQMLAPVIDNIAEDNKEIKVVRINSDFADKLVIKYSIEAIPTLILIKDGEEQDRILGVVSKSQILEMINKY